MLFSICVQSQKSCFIRSCFLPISLPKHPWCRSVSECKSSLLLRTGGLYSSYNFWCFHWCCPTSSGACHPLQELIWVIKRTLNWRFCSEINEFEFEFNEQSWHKARAATAGWRRGLSGASWLLSLCGPFSGPSWGFQTSECALWQQ